MGDVNQCTNTFFTVNSRQFSICNVLKGGSLSWKEFFRYYDIPSKFLADCLKLGTCPKHVRSHLMQVRHPFDRLLSTWRHIFNSGGWRLLERQFVDNPQLASLRQRAGAQSPEPAPRPHELRQSGSVDQAP